MDFFHGRGRCSEDDEVEMIRDMDKVPYASSSSSSSQYRAAATTTTTTTNNTSQPRWGAQFYDNNSAARFSYDHQSESSNLHHKSEVIINEDSNSDKRGGESEGGAGGDDVVVCIEREHMFDKVVTPSDVGKLNRLVIPKQHAEKYFPLDSTANEKGLLLNFEDRSGKPWRFRYSYWNSSQSYVMTKGWSRFVKEKKLYAGDIVSFERGAGDAVKDRLFIDWRRRSDVQDPGSLPPLPLLHHHHHHHPLSMPRSAPWGGLILPPTMSMPMPRDDMVWQRMNYGHAPPHMHNQHLQRTNYNGYTGGAGNGYNVMNSGSSPPIFYLRSSASQQIGVGLVQQGGETPMVFNSVPVVHGKASAKRLRLFGVNLECPIPENPEYQFLDSAAAIANPTMSSYTPQISSSIPQLQLRLYNNDSPPREQSESPKEDNPSSMSLDLDM